MCSSPWNRTTLLAVALIALSWVAAAPSWSATSVGSDGVSTENVVGDPAEGLELSTPTTFGQSGSQIRIIAASGALPLIGTISEPLLGGDVEISAGSGGNESSGYGGGDGGGVALLGGDGGDSTGSEDGGNGGGIFLRPGAAGQGMGSGEPGLPGLIILADSDNAIHLTVSQLGVALHSMLLLHDRSDTPTCDASTRGSMFVYNPATADPDAVCVCLDVSGADVFAWWSLNGETCP